MRGMKKQIKRRMNSQTRKDEVVKEKNNSYYVTDCSDMYRQAINEQNRITLEKLKKVNVLKFQMLQNRKASLRKYRAILKIVKPIFSIFIAFLLKSWMSTANNVHAITIMKNIYEFDANDALFSVLTGIIWISRGFLGYFFRNSYLEVAIVVIISEITESVFILQIGNLLVRFFMISYSIVCVFKIWSFVIEIRCKETERYEANKRGYKDKTNYEDNADKCMHKFNTYDTSNSNHKYTALIKDSDKYNYKNKPHAHHKYDGLLNMGPLGLGPPDESFFKEKKLKNCLDKKFNEAKPQNASSIVPDKRIDDFKNYSLFFLYPSVCFDPFVRYKICVDYKKFVGKACLFVVMLFIAIVFGCMVLIPQVGAANRSYIAIYSNQSSSGGAYLKADNNEYSTDINENSGLTPDIKNSKIHTGHAIFIFGLEYVKLAVFMFIEWIAVFDAIFNGYLEMLNALFSTNEIFYLDWHRAKTFADFWRRWNLAIHLWLNKYIFKNVSDLVGSFIPTPKDSSKIRNIISVLPKHVSLLLTFLVSGIIHEYVIYIMLKGVYGWFFVSMMLNYLFVLLTQVTCRQNTLWGNVFFWIVFSGVGQPMVLWFYYESLLRQR